MEAKRTYGSSEPHWIERLNGDITPVYAVRWDIRRSEGLAGSRSYGTNYMERLFDHLPTLQEVRASVEAWIDAETEAAITGGMTWEGCAVDLSAENRQNYTAEFNLAVLTGGENLPVTVRMGTDENPVYRDFTTLTELAAFYEAVRRHVRTRQQAGWLRKAEIDYTLYDEYLNSFEEMTDLQKAKAEKKLEIIRAKEARMQYYVNDVDVYCPAYQRAKLMEQAERGETITMQGVEIPSDVAKILLGKISATSDLIAATSDQKLTALELAETVQDVKAIDAAKDLPEVVRTTTDTLRTELDEKEANDPQVQAALFARQVINDVPMTANLALKRKVLFPVWGEEGAEFGKEVNPGFRLRVVNAESDMLYEVIQKHTLSEEWVPGMDTASLYKVVTEEHAGTKEDPIPYVQGMAFEEGKYYEQYGVLYICILTTETGYPNDLKDLQTIVTPVDDETDNEEGEETA